MLVPLSIFKEVDMEYWYANKKKIAPADMDNKYLLNVIKLLERKASKELDLFAVKYRKVEAMIDMDVYGEEIDNYRHLWQDQAMTDKQIAEAILKDLSSKTIDDVVPPIYSWLVSEAKERGIYANNH